MEDPLLPTGSGLRRRGESSSSGGFESTGLNNVIVGRRGDAITRGDKYQKAAAMVDQAEDGVGLPPEVLEQSNFEEAAKYYFAYISLDFFVGIEPRRVTLVEFL